MGMFDRVWIKCPECKEDIEFQSKGGECCLADYDITNIPPAIAGDIDGDVSLCHSCGYAARINVQCVVQVT